MNVLDHLQKRLQDHQLQLKVLSIKGSRIVTARILSFLLGVVWLIWSISDPDLLVAPYLSVGFFVLFFFILNKDKSNENKKLLTKNLVEIDEEEIRRLNGNMDGLPGGEAYAEPGHPYAHDLDIFGKHSLFQHINRTNLYGSNDLLANWLKIPVSKQEATARQEGIAELRDKERWRIDFQSKMRLLQDSKGKVEFFSDKPHSRFYLITAIILGLLTVAVLVFATINQLPSGYVWLVVLTNGTVLGIYNFKIQRKAVRTATLLKYLQAFLLGMDHIVKEEFSSPSLREAQKLVDQKAMKAIGQLKQIIFLLDSRGNLMWPFVNLIFLVDIYSGFLMNWWSRKNGHDFQKWIHAISFFEVHASCASYWQLHPEFTVPELREDDKVWKGKHVGHPLIKDHQRISNDFSLDTRVNLITGSNMSGKSTFLRTMGINTIMAWAGLPVCAEQLTLSGFLPYTSMRTQDDLSQGASSFYAELKRIQGLFSYLEKEKNHVLFLLDEILKGTNSHDRHIGALGIIQRLISLKSTGFISTHDLDLADHYLDNDQVRNLSFNSIMEEGKLVFDYRLHEGKCHSTNASELMKIMGIID